MIRSYLMPVQNRIKAPSGFTYFTARDGIRIYYQAVEPVGKINGIVISLQGINGGGTKGLLNERLAEKGFASYIIHQRGTGYSEGISGDIDTFETVVKDYQELIKLLKRKYPDIPVILLGHSMGGTFCLRLAEENSGDLLAGIILINPATKFKDQSVISLGRRVQFILNYIFRPHAVVIDATPDRVSNIENRMVVEETLQDKLTLKKMSPRYAAASTELMEQSVKEIQAANTPLLLILGGKDEVIDHRVTEHIYHTWKCPTKMMKIYPDDGHGGSIFDDSLEVVLQWIIGSH